MVTVVEVFVINALRELSDEEFENALFRLNPEQKERIMRYHFMADRKRGLIGILLAEYAISKAFGINPDEMRFEKNKYGKPHVAGKHGVHYNISHSGDYVVCAVGSMPVGIDVQEIKGGNLDIADRFFSKEEKEALALESSEDAKRKLFYDIWSLKEAYIKCIGMGLSMPLEDFGVVQRDGEYELIVKGERDEGYHFKKYDMPGSYSLCVCSKEDSFPTEYTELGYNEIIEI